MDKKKYTAPWFALTVNWMDSEMFENTTHGERLAWVCLLCHVKATGRVGKAKLRKSVFEKRYDLSQRAVSGMLERAQKCAAIELNGEFVTLCNWELYQWPTTKKKRPDVGKSGEVPEKPATTHHSPLTKDQPPIPRKRDEIWDAVVEEFGIENVTPSDGKKIGQIVRDLKIKQATPDEIKRRGIAYRAKYPKMAYTMHALMNNWDSLQVKKQRDVGDVLYEQGEKRRAEEREYQRLATLENKARIGAKQ